MWIGFAGIVVNCEYKRGMILRAPFTQLYVHLVWSTWDRLPLITDVIKRRLMTAIIAKCKQLGADVIAIELMPDHAHLLVRFPPTLAISLLAKEVKGSSSHFVNKELDPEALFKWQGAYGAFTLRTRDVPAIKGYIANQQRHHADGDVVTAWEPPSPSSSGAEEMPPRDY